MKKLILVLLILGMTNPFYAQDPIELGEVFISAMNYKYLSAVDHKEAAVSVQMLEKEVARFRAEGRDLYVDQFSTYEVSFYIPDGRIVALYDEEGNVLKTIERFKNVQLPEKVRMAVKDQFPKWKIVKDVYEVKYTEGTGAKKVYKMKLKNGNETIRIRMNEFGYDLQ